MFSLWTAASEETGEDLDKDDEADEKDNQDKAWSLIFLDLITN